MIINVGSGKAFEIEMFGVAADFDTRRPPYMDYQTALKDVLRNQPKGWNVTCPRTQLARRIVNRIRFSLPKSLKMTLCFYCAVGSAFDLYHGVDCFFRVSKRFGSEKQTVIVTVDLTLDKGSEKKISQKADILMTRDDLETHFLTLCDSIAFLLAECAQKMPQT